MSRLKLIDTAADPVRLSFPDLFVATQYEGQGKFRYNASFIVKPGGENDKRIQAAIKEAVDEKFAKKAPAILESVRGNLNKFCYVRGDLKKYDGYAGMLVLTGHRNQEAGRPLVIDGLKNPLSEKDGKPYAGCYVNASLDIYAQDGKNQGIRCGLVGVQFARDGDAFSGGRTASPDEFDVVDEGSDAAALV